MEKNGENVLTKYKPQIPKELITHFKYTMRSSDRDYKVLKNALDPYVQMCGLKTLQKFTDSCSKNSKFIDSDTGQFVGKFHPVKDTICSMVKDILQTYYGHFPEQVPDELWLHACLLGEGFSGEIQRMGGYKDLQAFVFKSDCFSVHITICKSFESSHFVSS